MIMQRELLTYANHLELDLAYDGLGPGRNGLRLGALALPLIEIAKSELGLPETLIIGRPCRGLPLTRFSAHPGALP
jgi:hypothetical protein